MDTTRTIVSFVKSWTNSAIHAPVIWAVLDCGHSCDVILKPTVLACTACGRHVERPHGQYATGPCTCGRDSYSYVWQPRDHTDADRLSQIGDARECKECAYIADAIEWLRALDWAQVHHSRFRHSSYHFYRLDYTSPSCFMLIGSVPACPEIDRVLADIRHAGASPLSPTEGA